MTRIVVGLILVAFTAGNVRADEKTDRLQAELDAAKKELEELRKRNNKLEDALVAAIVELEQAKRELLKAQNAAKLATAIADENAKKVEELVAWGRGLKFLDRVPQAPPPRPKGGRQPPALPENLRAVVTDVAGDLVTINVGIDGGLAVGSVLDLYRITDDEKRYLGTVKVTSSLNLFPKQAIVTFTPTRNVPIDRLKPEELPKKGDEARPQETSKP